MTFFHLLIEKFSIIQELEFFLRILVSCLCGALIGIERTRRFKEAGVRTHIVVACAAALMMIVSKYAFADLQVGSGYFAGSRGADTTQIAAQVVSGISFLGAGVIFKAGGTVRGLATAAGIWATAGIGITLGAGMYFEGLFVTPILILTQLLMRKFRRNKASTETVRLLIVARDSSQFQQRFERLMEEHKAGVTFTGITKNENGTTSFQISLMRSRKQNLSDLITYASSDDNVLKFETLPNV